MNKKFLGSSPKKKKFSKNFNQKKNRIANFFFFDGYEGIFFYLLQRSFSIVTDDFSGSNRVNYNKRT